jgi:hypothetical protein
VHAYLGSSRIASVNAPIVAIHSAGVRLSWLMVTASDAEYHDAQERPEAHVG